MSNLIYKGQSLLTILLDTEYTLTGATSVGIYYSKPDGTTGSWTGTIDSVTKVRYEVLAGNIDQTGDWKFQAWVIIGGRLGKGEVIKHKILEPVL